MRFNEGQMEDFAHVSYFSDLLKPNLAISRVN